MRIITLGSGSGGCGKTFVAANLGLALARRGVRTCVVDLDLGSADLHLRLGVLRPVRGLLHLLRGTAATLDEVVVPIDDDGMLQLIPGAGETVRALAPEEVQGLIEDIALLDADVAIIDLAAGFAPQQLDFFLSGDEQWVVARAEERSLVDAARFVKRARLRRVARGSAQAPRKPKIYSSLDALVRDMTTARREEVFTQRGQGVEPEMLLTSCPGEVGTPAETLMLPGDGVGALTVVSGLPDDAAIDRSIQDLTPVLDSSPGSAIARAIEELAIRVMPALPTGEPTSPVLLEPSPA